MRLACLSIVLAFTSCGGEPEPSRPEAPATETSESPTIAEAVGTEPVTTTVTPSAPPDVAFAATREVGGVALSVANHGTSEVSLRTSVAIEVEASGSFAPAPSTSSLALRGDCAHEAETCVTLAPGAELQPPSWLGTWGDMQCRCTRCGPVETGNYRLVVTTCDGAHRVESNVVAM